MANIVKEIMNPELLSVRPDDSAQRALDYILAFQVTAAPVVDGGIPVGVVSMRDLIGRDPSATVGDSMTTPAATISERASIDTAARQMAQQGLHRLIVIGDEGRATGVVSAVDMVCALTGTPVRHPAPFPHYDKELDLSWTDDMLLDDVKLDAVPNGPGVIALISGGQHRTERFVWAEAVHNVPARLADLTSRPQTEHKELERLLQREKGLRFRAAYVPHQQDREKAARVIMQRLGQPLLARSMAD